MPEITSIAYKVTELATLWSVSKQWVLNEIKQGRLPVRNISRGKRPEYRIDKQDAEQFWKSLSNTRPVKQKSQAALVERARADFSDFIQ